MKSPIRYVGGKFYIKNWVISHFDYSVRAYVEPFGGAGHILLAKPPHKIEIFNDIDNLLVNFFIVVREKGDELAGELNKLPYSEVLYRKWVGEGYEGLDDFEKAVRWFYIIRNSFTGNPTTTGWRVNYCARKSNAENFRSATHLIPLIRDRCKDVQFSCKDFRPLLKPTLNNPDILIYADPPYIDANYYKYPFTEKDHIELAELLNTTKAKVVISYAPHPLLDTLYQPPKWNRYSKSTTFCNAVRVPLGSPRPNKNELLFTNFSDGLFRGKYNFT